MKAETEIRQKGMRALIQALGAVEAERFVAALSRERFDYTEWRKSGLPSMDIETLSKEASRYAKSLDNCRFTDPGCVFAAYSGNSCGTK